MAKDALTAHARDELGISDITTARPVQAALTSAATFSVGASMPLLMGVISPSRVLVPIVPAASLGFLALRRNRSKSGWREGFAGYRPSYILGGVGDGSHSRYWEVLRNSYLTGGFSFRYYFTFASGT